MQSDCILLCLVIRILLDFGLVYNDIGNLTMRLFILRYDAYFRYTNVHSNDVPLVNRQ